jgi:hypothetical protein
LPNDKQVKCFLPFIFFLSQYVNELLLLNDLRFKCLIFAILNFNSSNSMN